MCLSRCFAKPAGSWEIGSTRGMKIPSRFSWFLTNWLRNLKDFPDVDGRTLAVARRDFERMLNVHRRRMEKSAQHVANPFSRRPVSEDEIRSRDTRRARHDVIGEQIFSKGAQLELWQLGNKRGGGV